MLCFHLFISCSNPKAYVENGNIMNASAVAKMFIAAITGYPIRSLQANILLIFL